MASTPWVPVERVATPAGGELVLWRREGDYQIRIDGLELISSRAHASEEAVAKLGCAGLEGLQAARVLVGGLGLGYTLRAALDCLAADASVVVAEVLSPVVAWNRGSLKNLAGNPLGDRRVTVQVEDVGAVSSATDEPFHAILLDVDNGPSAPTLPSNRDLYDPAGLASLRRALIPGGIVAIWTPQAEDALHRRLCAAGFQVSCQEVPARPGARVVHTIYLAVACPSHRGT